MSCLTTLVRELSLSFRYRLSLVVIIAASFDHHCSEAAWHPTWGQLAEIFLKCGSIKQAISYECS